MRNRKKIVDPDSGSGDDSSEPAPDSGLFQTYNGIKYFMNFSDEMVGELYTIAGLSDDASVMGTLDLPTYLSGLMDSDGYEANFNKIGANAFAGNTDITSVVIPTSVTEIEGGAFANCTNLASIVYNGDTYASLTSFTDASGITVAVNAFTDTQLSD